MQTFLCMIHQILSTRLRANLTQYESFLFHDLILKDQQVKDCHVRMDSETKGYVTVENLKARGQRFKAPSKLFILFMNDPEYMFM